MSSCIYLFTYNDAFWWRRPSPKSAHLLSFREAPSLFILFFVSIFCVNSLVFGPDVFFYALIYLQSFLVDSRDNSATPLPFLVRLYLNSSVCVFVLFFSSLFFASDDFFYVFV